MSRKANNKANNIRKKALEFVKKREWDKALNEFIRLSEVESNNPNVFNELGDLHMKIGNKREAFGSFHSAIDAYGRVSLYNNAVAVCKKIIRLNPNDHVVYGKLARLRAQQGFHKEAVAYATTFLEKIAQETHLKPEDVKHEISDLAKQMGQSPEVLEQISGYLIKWEFAKEAGEVLEQLSAAYMAKGLSAQVQDVRTRMTTIGWKPQTSDEGSPPTEPKAPTPGASAVPGFENHRAEKPAAPTGGGNGQAAAPPPNMPAGSGFDVGAVELPSQPATATEAAPAMPENVPGPTTQPPPVAEAPAPSMEASPTATVIVPPASSDPVSPPPVVNDPVPPVETPPMPETQTHDANDPISSVPEENAPSSMNVPPVPETDLPADPNVADDEVWVPGGELPDGITPNGESKQGDVVSVSEIVGQFNAEVTSDIDVEDYRSHYDLGMAYLEMELLPESIREFQFAANSSLYEVRCLEMIGLCFLRQNQPRLAIKQLEKGLSLIAEGDRESLGLRYNLGLAYEMTGDFDRAKTSFEDVYVVDVTFREVSQKFTKYSS